jgi:hypothetical protein
MNYYYDSSHVISLFVSLANYDITTYIKFTHSIYCLEEGRVKLFEDLNPLPPLLLRIDPPREFRLLVLEALDVALDPALDLLLTEARLAPPPRPPL